MSSIFSPLSKVLFSSFVITSLLFLNATQVRAAEQTTTRTETVCDTGAYGTQNCHQVVTTVPIHKPIETALPGLNVFAFALVAVAAGSFVAQRKLFKKE